MAGLSCRSRHVFGDSHSRHVFGDNMRACLLLIPQLTKAPRMKWTVFGDNRRSSTDICLELAGGLEAQGEMNDRQSHT